MSRWADDPEGAADALIAPSLDELGLDDLGLGGRMLLVNQAGSVPALLEARRLAFTIWNRRLVPGLPAAPWPPPGPFDLALVRLPKAREEQAMALHAALGVLRPGARLVVYGGNEEGIRSVPRMLQEITGLTRTITARGHGRILTARAPETTTAIPRGPLAAWRVVSRITLGGIARDWVSYPGLFARGGLDAGTALLVGALPALPAGVRVLDYGCGAGIIAAAVRDIARDAVVDALDNDTVALEAVRENAPAARRILAGDLTGAAGDAAYDVVLSNPPLHDGIAEDHTALERLITTAPSVITAGGILQLVVQRRVPLDRLLARHYRGITVVIDDGRYRVWRAVRP